MINTILILGIILLLLMFTGLLYYYNKLLNRVLSLFNKKKDNKLIYNLIIIIFTLLSMCIFNIIGLFFIYFVLISLIIDLIYYVFNKFKKNLILEKIYNTLLIPLFLTIIIFIYGFINMSNIVETRYTIYTDKDIDDIRILYISDSHYGYIFKKEDLDKVKSRFDSVDADIVILGGDIVDESTSKKDMEYIFSVLGDIKNTSGIYYVYGNHDRQSYSLNPLYSNKDLEQAIINNGINIVKDNYIEINEDIILFGREDYSFRRKSIGEYSYGIDKNRYLIMADHQPKDYQENISNGIDLIVSGHTHAGQIFPVEWFIKLFKTSDMSYGHKNIDGMDAVVSSGLVGWGYPIRTSKHSEYVIIDVKRR